MKTENCHYLGRHVYVSALIFFVILGGCRKLLEIDPPIDKITAVDAFGDKFSAAAVLTGIYYKMSETTFDNAVNPGLSADELSTIGERDLFYTNNLISTSVSWNYGEVFRCNSAIEGLNNAEKLDQDTKKQLLGEAKFTRAFSYFYLTNWYGNVPLILTTDYKKNSLVGRSTQEEVYQQIISDLKYAESVLPDHFVGSDAQMITDERVRPSKWAAKAMLARVYLYLKQWKDAEVMASEIINKSDLFELESLDKVFLTTSKEAIWQVQNSDAFSNSQEANRFILITPPNSEKPFTISEHLFNSFEVGDQRKVLWIGAYVDQSGSTPLEYHFPYKYKALIKSGDEPYTEYIMMLRLAEQYLIRAEARAELGMLIGVESAQSDLNYIRKRALLGDTKAIKKEEILIAIEHERQVELFTEWGHRWLDLKRTGRANVIMPNITNAKGGSWQSTDQLYPIPFDDLQKNPNLKPQNPGYN